MAWDEIKHSVNSDLNTPLNTLIENKKDAISTEIADVQSALDDSEHGLAAIKEAIEGGGGGGNSIIKITTSSDDFVGKTVTLAGPAGTNTTTFADNKTATFTVKYAGDYTATCEGSSVDIKVDAIGVVVNAELNPYKIYGFKINGAESDSATMVSYDVDYNGKPVENKTFTKTAKVNLSTGVFDAGDWADALDEFIMPRPCMLKSDGTVDYYLNPNDFTKKEDGSASDVKNASYNGNAMIEWGKNGKKFWWKVVPSTDKKSGTVYIADAQVDSDFHCYNHIDCKGAEKDHFYTPAYAGSYLSSKMRSLSGQTTGVSQTAETEINYAVANNTASDRHWYTETEVDRILINFLLVLIGKSTNTQAVFGYGRCLSSNTSAIATGTMDTKGMFFGSSDQTSGVKVFGMENYWGNTWRRIAGLINANGTIKIKLTPTTTDGSTANGYNLDGTGYIALSDCTPAGTSGNHISEMQFNEYGMFAKTASGSDSTYYADGYWFNNSQVNCAVVGGNWDNSLRVGAFCVNLNGLASVSYASFGACLSYK